ncbi:hypothetical protein FRX31_002450, partial [Thalictrum thalictroides]
AEDVFASLSIPLMKLVGLKTKEMALEGRSSTIFMDSSNDDDKDSMFVEWLNNKGRSSTVFVSFVYYFG